MPGRVYFWNEKVLYVGPGLAAGLHAHHAVQACLPLSGPVRLRSSPGARWGSYDGAVIPSDVPHESDTPVARLVTLWLDAETPEARRLVEPGRQDGLSTAGVDSSLERGRQGHGRGEGFDQRNGKERGAVGGAPVARRGRRARRER